MPLTDPVPSSSFDVLERNVQDTDKFVNQETGTFTNRAGKQVKPIPVIEAEANAAISSIDWTPVGLFADGVTFTKITDFAIDSVGIQWIYTGAYPFTATAGTVPSEPLYQAVLVKDARLLSNMSEAEVLADGSTEPRRLGERFADTMSIKDFGAVGSGSDDTAAYQAMSEAAEPLDRSSVTSDVQNKYGGDLSPVNLIQNNTTGRLFNPKSAFKNSIFGMETLQHWFGKFADVSNKNNGNLVTAKVVCTGDSTTFGFHGSYGGVPAILSVMAQNRGYPNVTVINNGRSAQATIPWPATGLTNSWKTTFLANDIAEDPDLLIVRWGANDPFYNVSPLGDSNGVPVDDQETVLAKVITGYRETLSLLRNSVGMDVKNLSIILATPGPMNDVFFGRDEIYFQRLSDAMRQMALDYQCAYIDIYGLYSNSWGGVNDWYDGDATSGTARAIHPSDVLYEHIAGAIAELAFPDWGVDWKSNGVRNNSGTKGSLQGTNPPSSFIAGINIDRMGDGLGSSKGKPYNGTSITTKQSDGATLQISSPLNSTLGAGISLRHGWNSVWNSYWNGAVYNVSDLVYQNGWSDFGGAFEVGTYKLSLDGTVALAGVLSKGTTTSGTLLFTLPVGFRPSKNVIAFAATETGDCLLIIAPTGAVTITRFSGGAYIILNTVSFPVYS